MSHVMTGTFYDSESANAAVDRLIDLGYRNDQINVIMSQQTRGRYFEHGAPGESQGANIARGAAGGGAIGGTLGAIVAAALTATGVVGATIATGGVAAPFIAGPAAAALAGAGAGAAAGSALGALAGALSKEDADRIQHDVSAGGIVVAVDTEDTDASAVQSILQSDTGSART